MKMFGLVCFGWNLVKLRSRRVEFGLSMLRLDPSLTVIFLLIVDVVTPLAVHNPGTLTPFDHDFALVLWFYI